MAHKNKTSNENDIVQNWHSNISDNSNYKLHIVSTPLPLIGGIPMFWSCEEWQSWRRDEKIDVVEFGCYAGGIGFCLFLKVFPINIWTRDKIIIVNELFIEGFLENQVLKLSLWML